ncbi:dual specificity protein phosphatase 12 [Hyphopichia burtonii NRRL Y-1933]|uniref:protein-tyrosine-phosphatase n=1 Tax=Hyphopichia burtonii NRRL Y-1933 TaxID=984485 RepID=A0A1E4RK35_9ASCO|nr:dual specificity protein phosphatase 12 [Hyphopichia burtonii NRRL Y-1933]ODV67644.1 dual specificity protein phosphatase 12 [Hyphopichia burtonii NRRL Y-1933]
MIYRILGGIYLSSIEPINANVDLRSEFNITHVLSVIPGPISSQFLQNYIHKQIEVTDEETSNLLQYFPETNEFIDFALFKSLPAGSKGDEKKRKHEGAILIHCSQGVSRSVSVIMAYLMFKYKLKFPQALHAIKRKSPSAEPNEGFQEQLKLFELMEYKVEMTNEYYKQFLINLNLRLDPSGSSLRELHFFKYLEQYEDELEEEEDDEIDDETALRADPEALSELRCKRCRNTLALKKHLEFHEPPDADSKQSSFVKTAAHSRRIISKQEASKTCSHHFMREPVSWMKVELQGKGELEGRFLCPKCEAKVGGYSWKGSRCSCGKWMIPAIHLQTAKVDYMRKVKHIEVEE